MKKSVPRTAERQRFLTARDLEALHQAGQRELVLEPDLRLTPLALDRAKELGLTIARASRDGANGRGVRVPQNKTRRHGAGLKAYDPALAFEGFTLFTSLFGDGTVYLVDMQGEVVHTWRMPYPPGLYGYLEDGLLIYNGKTREGLESVSLEGHGSTPWEVFKGGALLEATWDGTIVAETRYPDHHHDGRKARNGNALLLCVEETPREIAARIRSGIECAGGCSVVYSDYIAEFDGTGELVWEWHAWEHLDPASDPIVGPYARHEWTHGNTVAEMPDGNIVVSLRNLSQVLVIERPSGRILHRVTAPTVANQHDPRPLPNGNLLIFDNGAHRIDVPLNCSRVVEVEPHSGAIVWQYQDPTATDFFSPYISSAQRLPNGNTLICEGCFGRIFEVTRAGELVWEYVNPHVCGSAFGENNWVFRAFRYSKADIEAARRRR